MTYRIARSLASLRSEVNAAYPDRDKKSDGWIGDPSHSARVSDHNPDGSKPLGIVRALDLDKDDKDGSRANIAQTVVDAILRTRDPRVKYVIWRGRIFSSYNTTSRRAWQWGPYSGPNGHFEHVHVSVVGGTAGDRSGPWGVRPDVTGAVRPTPPAPAHDEELDMDKATFEQWVANGVDHALRKSGTVRAEVTRLPWTQTIGRGDVSMHTAIATMQAQINLLAAQAGNETPVNVELDTSEVARQIADSLPDDLARRVVDEIRNRLDAA